MTAPVADAVEVHVIDDDEVLRSSVTWLLRSVGFRVVAHTSASEFLESGGCQSPCCLVVDLVMPEVTGFALYEELKRECWGCAVVMLTGHADVPTAVKAMKMGLFDFLEKPCSQELLVEAVRRGLEFAHSESFDIQEENEVQQRIQRLTSREREVFDHLTVGKITKEIAARLGISCKTVDVHRSRIAEKLRLDSPTQLAQLVAVQNRRQRRLRRASES